LLHERARGSAREADLHAGTHPLELRGVRRQRLHQALVALDVRRTKRGADHHHLRELIGADERGRRELRIGGALLRAKIVDGRSRTRRFLVEVYE
jgi:hypothetical protein